jgi:hypothetical protein
MTLRPYQQHALAQARREGGMVSSVAFANYYHP